MNANCYKKPKLFKIVKIINASFNRSKRWENVKVLKLIKNMRIQNMSGDNAKQA